MHQINADGAVNAFCESAFVQIRTPKHGYAIIVDAKCRKAKEKYPGKDQEIREKHELRTRMGLTSGTNY